MIQVVGVVAAVLGVSLLIVIHEAGHFLVARAFGMKVERFSVGFGKVLLSVKRGGTEFVVSALPLGGYVKILGMAPGEDVDPKDPALYSNQAAWRRFLAILAGPAMNFLAAAVIAWALLSGPGLLRPDPAAAVGRVVENTPAAQAGLQNGDRVISIAGAPVSTWGDLVTAIRSHPGQEIHLVVERGEGAAAARLELHLTPEDHGGRGRAGFEPHRIAIQRAPGAALGDAIAWTTRLCGEQIAGFGAIFSRGKGGGGFSDLGGPLSIIQSILRAFKDGTREFANALWVISIALAVFNILPFPGLDGSRLVFLVYELVARRRVNAKVENWIHTLGILALLGVLALVTVVNDLGLSRLFHR